MRRDRTGHLFLCAALFFAGVSAVSIRQSYGLDASGVVSLLGMVLMLTAGYLIVAHAVAGFVERALGWFHPDEKDAVAAFALLCLYALTVGELALVALGFKEKWLLLLPPILGIAGISIGLLIIPRIRKSTDVFDQRPSRVSPSRPGPVTNTSGKSRPSRT